MRKNAIYKNKALIEYIKVCRTTADGARKMAMRIACKEGKNSAEYEAAKAVERTNTQEAMWLEELLDRRLAEDDDLK